MKKFKIHFIWSAILALSLLGTIQALKRASSQRTERTRNLIKSEIRSESKESIRPKAKRSSEKEIGSIEAPSQGKLDQNLETTGKEVSPRIKAGRLEIVLQKIEGPGDLGEGLTPSEKLALARNLMDQDKYGRESLKALSILKELDSSEANSLIFDLLKEDRPLWIRRLAADSLTDRDLSGMLPKLYETYYQGDLVTQTGIAVALKRNGDSRPLHETAEKLGVLLLDSDGSQREKGIRLLEQLDDPIATPYLQEALQDRNSAVRLRASRALRTLKFRNSFVASQERRAKHERKKGESIWNDSMVDPTK